MKKLLIFIPLFALCAIIFPHLFVHAQDQNLPSTDRTARQQQDVARFFRQHERVTFNTREVAEQVRRDKTLSIYTASASFDLVLTPHDMRGPNYRAVEVGADGVERSVEMGAVRTYKGEVIGRDDSQARFTIDDQTLEGLIITPEERYMVEPMGKYSAAAEPTDFIVYRASDVIEGRAGAGGEGPIDRELRHTAAGIAPQVDEAIDMDAVDAVAAVRDIEISTEADYEYVSQLGGTVAANNEIMSIMNMVEGVYQQQLDLTFTVVFQHTWPTNNDPYGLTAPGGCYNNSICGGPPPGGLDDKGILNEFMEHWNANYPTGSPSANNPRRDLAHIWTGKNVDGNVIGLAWLDVVCSTPTFSYGFSQRLTTAPIKYIVTAHEIGHNLSASHTSTEAGCPNTIMAGTGGPNSSLQFCATSINQIKAYANANSGCLAISTTPPPCTYTITPASKSFTSTGGNGNVSIKAGAGCAWTATSNASWATITAGSGSGNGTASYNVSANNSTASRTGTLTIAGKTYTITQAGVKVVAAPTLRLLRISPITVAGCKSITGTVTLVAPAPAGGVNVTISDNLTAARPPARVTIPAGATSKTFTITTVPVTTTQTGTINAILGTVTKSSTLTVRPIGVQSLSLSPSSLVGPASPTGTVILECAAPARGIVVALSSTNPAIASPTVSSITIPSGATTKTFTIRTVDVATPKSAIIKATASGISKTVTLTIN